jgi:hypothetical protein
VASHRRMKHIRSMPPVGPADRRIVQQAGQVGNHLVFMRKNAGGEAFACCENSRADREETGAYRSPPMRFQVK